MILSQNIGDFNRCPKVRISKLSGDLTFRGSFRFLLENGFALSHSPLDKDYTKSPVLRGYGKLDREQIPSDFYDIVFAGDITFARSVCGKFLILFYRKGRNNFFTEILYTDNTDYIYSLFDYWLVNVRRSISEHKIVNTKG